MDVTWRKCICTIGNAQKFGSQKSAVNCQQGGGTAPALLPAERASSAPVPQGSLPCPHAPPWSPAAPRWPSPARSGRRSRARRSRARRTCRGSWSGTRSPRPTSLCWSQTANKIWAERTQSSSALKLAWSPLLNKVVHMRFTPGKFKSTFPPPKAPPSGTPTAKRSLCPFQHCSLCYCPESGTAALLSCPDCWNQAQEMDSRVCYRGTCLKMWLCEFSKMLLHITK